MYKNGFSNNSMTKILTMLPGVDNVKNLVLVKLGPMLPNFLTILMVFLHSSNHHVKAV